jgi:c(7)-type cytochrome triheme protein
VISVGVAAALGLAALAGGALPKLPPDRVLRRAADSPGEVVFSHASHVDERRPSCTSCHPGAFSILRKGAARIQVTHQEMEAGRQCGACHDGKAARGLEDCAACHRDE